MEWFWLATASALFSAAAAVMQKKVLFSLPALEFSLILSLVITVISVWIPFAYPLSSLTLSSLALLILKSILGACAFLLVMIAIEQNELSSALPLLGATPAVTALIAFVLLHETLNGQELVGIGCIMVGTYIVEKRPHTPLFTTLRTSHTHGAIVGAILLFALSSVADRFLLVKTPTHPNVVLFIQHVVYTIVFGIVMLIRKTRLSLTTYSSVFFFILAVALFTFAYRTFQLEATQRAPIALVLAVKRTSIFYASFIGGTFFKEERLFQKLIGAACIIAGGFFILRHLS
ncbi:MAG: DMT family transporter [Bacteroidetes bacterium]|nr:DMT family transporter [Bacteroidota bacterium]